MFGPLFERIVAGNTRIHAQDILRVFRVITLLLKIKINKYVFLLICVIFQVLINRNVKCGFKNSY